MAKRKGVQFAGLLISQSLLLVLLLIGLLVVGSQATPVYAGSINVDDEGTDSPTCGAPDAPCRTIPYALANRASAGDTVFVWEGTYTETITLEAGVVISGAGATRTFIDGEGVRGPMVSASGSAIDPSTVLRGVTIRRGTAANGGGAYITDGASPLIEDCIVSENVATDRGGGLYVYGTATLTLRDTEVISNTSAGAGGGMYQATLGGDSRLDLFGGHFENNETTTNRGGGLWIAGTVVITGTDFVNNRAAYFGGGIYQRSTTGRAELIGGLLEGNTAGVFNGGGLGAEGTAALSTTQVVGNSAGELGGGVWAGNAQVTRAVFANNQGGLGGGLYAGLSVVMTSTSVISNTAHRGGGVYGANAVDIVNSLFARNSTDVEGAAIYMSGESVIQTRLRHLTIVSPTIGTVYPPAAIMVRGQATAMITNTIVGGYPCAIVTSDSGTAYEDYNLYYNLGPEPFLEFGGLVHSGGHSLHNLDPRFVNPLGDDYHLGPGSAAIDAGIELGVTEDIDGDRRVPGLPPDIGADEVVPMLAVDKTGPTWFNLGDPVTYVLSVTNIGIVTAYNVTLTDTLPIGASFVGASDGGSQSGGVVSWPPFDIAPGGAVVSRTFTVTASDTITNHDYLATAEGFPGVAGVRAIISTLNPAPVADAGAPQTVHAGTVTLDGSASADPEGDDLIYLWVQTGGTAVTLSDPTAASPTFTAPSLEGVLTFQLTVTDTFGAEDSDTTTVTIANTAPTADAGSPQTVHSGTVTLDGSASADSDGDALLYHWLQTGGTLVGLSDPTDVSPTFTAPSLEGVLTFQLTVTDTFGAVDSDTTTVTIANAAPSADAGAPQTVHAGTVTLDGSASADSDTDALLYHWLQTDGTTVTLSDPTAASPTFTAPSLEDVLTFQLTVTDTFGADDFDITTVSIVNTAPTANAGAPQTVHAGTVTLDGSASADSDSDALLYHWLQTGGTAVTLSDPTAASPTFATPLVDGLLTFQLTVTDTFGADDSDTTTVSIVNTAPTADAGSPQNVHGGTVTLNGSASTDPDGDALLYHWLQTDGTTVTLSDPTAASPTFTAPLADGLLTFQLTVTDTFGATDSDTTTVTVGNAIPSADAGSPQTVHSGTVILDGSASTDPEGDALLYHWLQTDGTTVTLSDPTAVSPTFTAPLVEGVLTFQLTVTDTFGAADSDTTTVTIANEGPDADAGTYQVKLPDSLVTLDGSASSDPDGDQILYLWVQVTGIPVALSNPNAVSPTFTAPSSTCTVAFSLTVTDTFGVTDSDVTEISFAVPELSITKSGPSAVMAGELITYTLVITNSAPLAASSLLITDAIPVGATFISASHGGTVTDGIVTWMVPSLGPTDSLSRTFTVTATETITNSIYGVSCTEGITATGRSPVTTRNMYTIYLPVIFRNY
jgi:uncharacterized repeat protein (TIGR01451 family)